MPPQAEPWKSDPNAWKGETQPAPAEAKRVAWMKAIFEKYRSQRNIVVPENIEDIINVMWLVVSDAIEVETKATFKVLEPYFQQLNNMKRKKKDVVQ